MLKDIKEPLLDEPDNNQVQVHQDYYEGGADAPEWEKAEGKFYSH